MRRINQRTQTMHPGGALTRMSKSVCDRPRKMDPCFATEVKPGSDAAVESP
jgi:hypothetical protein